MKSSSKGREFVPIVVGLAGMGAYPVALHVPHPAMIEGDLVHGIWFGICLGIELIGLYFLLKQRKSGR
jgi:hypothetical protein